MTSSRDLQKQIETIFNDALEVPEAERRGLIEQRCAGDSMLLMEVSSLLDACAAEERLASTHRRQSHVSVVLPNQRTRVGAFEIEKLIGRGGMGAVYLSHRADGNFDQQVAIKLIDAPLATDLFRERFRLERQILAGLNHPFIARLLDGGITPGGEPYLAMEYVEGTPIDRYCRDQGISLAERLALFVRVCEAVQFAHQNLVVHRDLKPDNILVTPDGLPRLLDFGTAKLLSQSTAAGSDLTRMGFRSFTPQYASPEQVLGEAITTAADTYSLGVLLYLLAVGKHPYELKEFTTAEMVRVICERPPLKPALSFDGRTRIDADLEAILLRALRKEASQRYQTVSQLIADIKAYLEHRAVSARRGTFRYRAGKFVRRNRVVVVAAAVVAISVIAGFAGVLWQARIANGERRKAEARASDLRQLSNSLLSELDEAIKDLPGSTGAQRLLVTRVLEHLDRMATDANGDRLSQLDLVDAYTRLGNIQGNPYDQNLGDPAGAVASLDKALSIASSLLKTSPRDHDSLRAMASVEQSRSEVFWGMERTPEAVASIQSAVRAFDALVAGRNVTPALLCEAGAAYGTLGDELGQPGTPSLNDLSAALAAYRKDLELEQRALRIDPAFPRALRGLPINEMKIGNIEIVNDPAQALKDFELAEQQYAALPESRQGGLFAQRMHANLLRKRAQALRGLGEFDKAAPLFDQAIAIQKQISAADPEDSRSLFDVYVDLIQAAENFEDAADPELEMSADRRKSLTAAVTTLTQAQAAILRCLKLGASSDDRRADLADAQVRLATAEHSLGTKRYSSSVAASGLATLKDLVAKNPNSILLLDMELSDLLNVEPSSLRDPSLAIASAEREAALTRRQQAPVLLSLAEAYRAAGQFSHAQETAREGLLLLPSIRPGAAVSLVRRHLQRLAETHESLDKKSPAPNLGNAKLQGLEAKLSSRD